MITRAALLVAFFWLLAAFQTSFLSHAPLFGFVPNLLLGVPLLLALKERPSSSFALWSALVAGFFWDVFSGHLLGQGASILVAAAILLKIAKARYVRLPILQ